MINSKILLSDIVFIENPEQYKIHFASFNGEKQPLDVFVNDLHNWHYRWNAYRGTRERFTRQYIFSLIDFLPEEHKWLFGGIHEVVKRSPKQYSYHKVKLVNKYSNLIGRLLIDFHKSTRLSEQNFENYYNSLVVSEIFKERYDGSVFCGFENINITFNELQQIMSLQKKDWKSSLEHIKGVYVIFDNSNGKKYVGSAFGELGVWGRWNAYAKNGHGGNKDVKIVIQKAGIKYAQKNFQFSLLEFFDMKTSDNYIMERETYWKKALLSRGAFGYNNN